MLLRADVIGVVPSAHVAIVCLVMLTVAAHGRCGWPVRSSRAPRLSCFCEKVTATAFADGRSDSVTIRVVVLPRFDASLEQACRTRDNARLG
jgi:hypothetical protein